VIPVLRNASVRCPWCGNIVHKKVPTYEHMERVVFKCSSLEPTEMSNQFNDFGCQKRFIGLILFKVTVEEIQKVFDE